MSQRFHAGRIVGMQTSAGVMAAAQLITTAAFGAPILWSDNGHYYEVIEGVTNWNEARDAAAARSHLGLAGHLVTVTSAEENLFLTATFGAGGLEGHFLGGYQLPGSIEPAGGWSWVTGEAFTFLGWFPGEPSNFNGLENVTIFAHPEQAWGKGWNDVPESSFASGYVVEYEVPTPGAVLLAMAAVFRPRGRR